MTRLIAERGAIREQLEASFPSPGAEIVTTFLGVESATVRGPADRLAPAHDGASRAQPAAPGPWRRINWGLVVLGLVVGYLALLCMYASQFDL